VRHLFVIVVFNFNSRLYHFLLHYSLFISPFRDIPIAVISLFITYLVMEEEERHCRRHRARMHHTFATVCLLVLSVTTCSECRKCSSSSTSTHGNNYCRHSVKLLFYFILTESYQAPRFITQPTSTKNVIGEGQTKIIQCQALGKCFYNLQNIIL